MKKRTTNVENIYDIKSRAFTSSESILTIEASKHKINLHLGDFTINYIAEELWKIVNEKQKLINSNKEALRGED